MNRALIAASVSYGAITIFGLALMRAAAMSPQDESASLKREPAWGDSLNLNSR